MNPHLWVLTVKANNGSAVELGGHNEYSTFRLFLLKSPILFRAATSSFIEGERAEKAHMLTSLRYTYYEPGSEGNEAGQQEAPLRGNFVFTLREGAFRTQQTGGLMTNL